MDVAGTQKLAEFMESFHEKHPPAVEKKTELDFFWFSSSKLISILWGCLEGQRRKRMILAIKLCKKKQAVNA
jgi:hypothetical protein